MSDPTIEVIDNSDLDLSNVSLRDPVIDKAWVTSTITDLYWQALTSNKTADGKAKQLVIELATDEAATSTDGRIVNPGHKTKVNIYATPVGGLTQDMVNKKLARFQHAVLGTQGRFGTPDQYIGKRVRAHYESEPSKDDPTMLFQRVTRWEKAS